MKKLIFLLIFAVFFAGMVSALDTAHPPDVLTVEMSDTIEAAMFGDNAADGLAVTPDTVLAALPVVELTSFQAVMALYNYEETAIQPTGGAIPVINTGQFWAETIAETDYCQRC